MNRLMDNRCARPKLVAAATRGALSPWAQTVVFGLRALKCGWV